MTTQSGRAALAMMLTVLVPLAASGQQATTPQPQPPRSSSSGQASTAPPPSSRTSRSSASVPQGFSVVLVLGDLQAAAGADDVPPAARKALTDMRDFLPFKSYKLLDAAWLLCCGNQLPTASPEMRPVNPITQILRGPDDQEYELKLSASRAENSRVFVRFALESGGEAEPTQYAIFAEKDLARALADYQDKKTFLEKQLQEQRQKVEAGVMSPSDAGLSKIELEIRSLQRRIDDVNGRMGKGTRPARGSMQGGRRQSIIDTSFTMDVGETVVVGTSRQKGGSKALIALLTAVPPRSGGRE
jgi:hypothetical protein